MSPKSPGIIESMRSSHREKTKCPTFHDSIKRQTTSGHKKDFYDEVEDEVFLKIQANGGGESEALRQKILLKHIHSSVRKNTIKQKKSLRATIKKNSNPGLVDN